MLIQEYMWQANLCYNLLRKKAIQLVAHLLILYGNGGANPIPEALAKGCTFQTNLQKSVRSHRNYLSSTLLFLYLLDILQTPVNLLDFIYLAI
jgi:hypothetical protein